MMVINSKSHWWVVQTKSRAEFIAIQHLERQNFVTYCPLYPKEIRRNLQVKIETVTPFPRYVFIQANQSAQQNIHVIRSTKGVSQLLKVGEVPLIAYDSLIENIRQLEKAHRGEVAQLFQPGDVLQIKDGIYKGLEAVYQMKDGLERAVVLINLINSDTPLHLFKHQLSKI